IGEVSQVITGNSARRRSQRRDQRIAICSLRDCQRHWHEKYVRRHQEYGAFDESDDGQPKLGSGAGGLLQGPVVKLAQHRGTIPKRWQGGKPAWTRQRGSSVNEGCRVCSQRRLRMRLRSSATTLRRGDASSRSLGSFSAIPRSRSRRSISIHTSLGWTPEATQRTTRL